MSKDIYCGRGDRVSYTDFMDLISVSFSHEPSEAFFETLLPKLYREELRPQDQNYVVTEDGVPAAAVGAYDHELIVCGRTLRCRGVGNVAVHPEHRSKGYMKATMNAAMQDMIADGIVLSALGGKRQRYLYFGYDKAGPAYTYSVSRDNIRHVYGDLTAPYTVREVTDKGDVVIDKILLLSQKNPMIAVRPREEYLAIASSWRAKLLAFLDGDRFVGYCILDNSKSVSEVQAVEDEAFMPLVRSLLAYLEEKCSILLLPHQLRYREELTRIAEGVSVGHMASFNVLCYRAVIEAFLALKLSYTSLPDGEMTLLIHGYAKDERIRICVKNGEPLVEEIDDSTLFDLELSHAEAIAFLFSPFSPTRETASDLARLWFPLPLCTLRADKV